jgi:hypothetical protein
MSNWDKEERETAEERALVLAMIRAGYDKLVEAASDDDMEAIARLSRLRLGLEACADTAVSLQHRWM